MTSPVLRTVLVQLCASTLCSASPHTVQLRPDGISDTSMITSNFDGAVGFPSPEDISFFNEKKVHDEESIQLLTSGGTQLLGKSTVNSICDRGSSPTGKNLRLPELLIITRGESGNLEGVLDKLGESDCLGLHVSNNPLQKIPQGTTQNMVPVWNPDC